MRSATSFCCRRLGNVAWNQPSSSGLSGKPIVSFPAKIMRKLEKVRAARELARDEFRRKHRLAASSPLLIACSDRRYNHYRDQFYPNGQIRLASEFWKNNKHAGEHFTLLSHGKNPAMLPKTFEEITFDQLGLNAELLKAIEECHYKRPTIIQKLVIPRLMSKKTNLLFSAETGSGKTLAFALPLLHHLLQSKQSAPASQPKGLILAPSKELAEQICDNVAILSQYTSLDVRQLKHHRDSMKTLNSSADLVVSTPGLVQALLSSNSLDLSQLEHLVIDEADSLLDQSFSELVLRILGQVQIQIHRDVNGNSQSGAQLILASATFPRDLDTLLTGVVDEDNIMVIKTDNLHKLMPHVSQQFLRLTKPQKPEKILQILKKSGKESFTSTTLVFVKNLETCWWVTEFLKTSGIKAEGLRGNLSREEREKTFRQFRNEQLSVLVATDIASRGLDTINVGHVINYDCPRDISDYIHRAGRVGRVGSKRNGVVTTFVCSSEEVDTVQVIEKAARQASMLPNIYDNISLKRNSMPTDEEEIAEAKMRTENVEYF